MGFWGFGEACSFGAAFSFEGQLIPMDHFFL